MARAMVAMMAIAVYGLQSRRHQNFVTDSLDLPHTSNMSVHACKRKHAACHQPTHHTIQAKETKELLQDKEHMEDVAKCVGWLGVVEVSVRGNVRLGS